LRDRLPSIPQSESQSQSLPVLVRLRQRGPGGGPRCCHVVALRLHHAREGRILSPMDSPIIIPASPLNCEDLEQFRGMPFDAMIKFVVDIDRGLVALGGEMHADAETVLLQGGSKQEFLWGGNLHAWETPPHLEFTSLINIRPSSGNRSMVVGDAGVRAQMLQIVQRWVVLSW